MAKRSSQGFADSIDRSAFEIDNGAGLKSQVQDVNRQAGDVNFDWSKLDDALGSLQGTADVADARAQGQDLTAGFREQQKQGLEQGGTPQTVADLGKLLMLKAKTAGSQASDVAGAQAQQQAQEADKARAMHNTIFSARQQMMGKEIDLNNQKFQIQMQLKQTTQGLDLAQKQMLQNYYLMKAGAKNAADAINLDARNKELQNVMSYVQMGIGAAASTTAGWAAGLNKGPTGVGSGAGGTNAGIKVTQ